MPSECSVLDDVSEEEARASLLRCCGSSRWVERMLAERPFSEREKLFAAASRIWRELDVTDWDEAFSHHPRIGEPTSARAAATATSSWASNEQAGATRAADDVRAAIAEGNRAFRPVPGLTINTEGDTRCHEPCPSCVR